MLAGFCLLGSRRILALYLPNRSVPLGLTPRNSLTINEPLVGIEPTTYSLRMNCSTPELLRRFSLGNAVKLVCDILCVKQALWQVRADVD